jgi:hypothetical protein
MRQCASAGFRGHQLQVRSPASSTRGCESAILPILLMQQLVVESFFSLFYQHHHSFRVAHFELMGSSTFGMSSQEGHKLSQVAALNNLSLL